MQDPFFSKLITHPFSFPAIVIYFFILFITVTTKINITIVKDYFKARCQINKSDVKAFIVSVLIFISSSFLLFCKMTEIPPAGLDVDDAIYAVAAYFLKNLGHDSHNIDIPFYSLTSIKYHKEVAWEVGQRALPVYFQLFLQYFVEPGFFSIRLESTMLMFITSIFIGYTFYLLSGKVVPSILCGALFNILPWTRILARITPESTSYCFGASCFLFSFLYLLKNRNILAMFFYLCSLVMFFQSYTPALMFTPLCAVLIPIIASVYSKEHKKIGTISIVLSLIFLAFIYFQFRNEEGYKYNLGRANAVGCLPGLNTFNVPEIINSLKKNAHIYIGNYFGYFLPQFLFFSGDPNLRHNTGFGGQLFAFLCIAFYIGLVYLFEKRKEEINLRVLLGYLIISALPYSICLEGGLNVETKLPLHALRASCMLPPIALITALGLMKIFYRSRILFFVYSVILCINIYYFYYDYFHVYPVKLGNGAVDDPGLRKVSKKALQIIRKHPEKKLFYRCTVPTVAYHNIKTIGVDSLFNGDGILSKVYDYERRGDIQLEKGDLVIVQERFNYNDLNKGYKFILRVPHPYLPNNEIGASLFEITD